MVFWAFGSAAKLDATYADALLIPFHGHKAAVTHAVQQQACAARTLDETMRSLG